MILMTPCRPLAERCRCDAKEQREDDDLQDLVVGHRLDRALRDEVSHEILERQRGRIEVGRSAGIGQRQVEVVAWTQDVDHDQAEQ